MKSLDCNAVTAVRKLAVLALCCTAALSLGCNGPLASRHARHVPQDKRMATAADDDSIPAAAEIGLADSGKKSSGHAHAHDDHGHSHTAASTKKKSEDVAELADDDF
jgi:hypothetical protein